MSDFYPFNPGLDQVMQSDVDGDNPDRAFIAHVVWDDPAAAAEDASGLGNVATSAGAATNVDVSGITQPDVPRNVVINPDGTTADVAAGNITVQGTDIEGNEISEDIAVVANQAHDTVSTGSKAFKTITAITIPAQDGAAATFLFGYGDKLGLPFKRATLPCIAAYLNETLEATAPTIAADADNIEGNTIDLNSALDGNQVDAYLVV
jgi:hypothetical protein